jgi:hypothetical protein
MDEKNNLPNVGQNVVHALVTALERNPAGWLTARNVIPPFFH